MSFSLCCELVYLAFTEGLEINFCKGVLELFRFFFVLVQCTFFIVGETTWMCFGILDVLIFGFCVTLSPFFLLPLVVVYLLTNCLLLNSFVYFSFYPLSPVCPYYVSS